MFYRLLLGMTIAIASFQAFAEEAKTKPTFTMSTTGFLNEGALPVMYTCDGKDVSPELAWKNAPANTKTFTLLMKDKNAEKKPHFHWVVFDIPKSKTKIDEGLKNAPEGAKEGKNSLNKISYNGPCPPKGGAHTYEFVLYALDTTLNLPNGATGVDVTEKMKGHIVGETSLSTVYSRWLK